MQGIGCRVVGYKALGCRIQGKGRKMQGVRCRVQGCRMQGIGLSDVGCRVQGCRLQGVGCRVQGCRMQDDVWGYSFTKLCTTFFSLYAFPHRTFFHIVRFFTSPCINSMDLLVLLNVYTFHIVPIQKDFLYIHRIQYSVRAGLVKLIRRSEVSSRILGESQLLCHCKTCTTS